MNHALRTVTPLLLVAPLASASFADTLAFTEKSFGLNIPGMEHGRTEVEFADINKNGCLDILSIGDHGSPFVNSGQSGIMVWFGDCTGNWSHYQTGYFGYGGIAVGDVNNNGVWDVGYGMHHDWSPSGLGVKLLEVALGDGTGKNWTPWYDGLATAGETWGMFSTDFADVNNNGWLDIGSISFGCCAGLHVYTNLADGSWSHSFGFTGGNSAMEFHFGDFSGDGNADFAASHGSGTVYLGDGTGNFTLADGNLPGPALRTGISIGDVTGNGRDDLAWTQSNAIRVFTMTAPGQWTDLTANLIDVGLAFHRTQIADMTLNGRGEIIAARPGKLVIYSLDDEGAWNLITDITLPQGCSQAAALRAGHDATHNGYPDILVITRESCGLFNTRGKNTPRFFANANSPDNPAIHPVFPSINGGQTFINGQTRFIRWHAAIPHDQRDDGGEELPGVTIELSISGRNGPWQTIADRVPPSGRFQWTVNKEVTNTKNAHLRLTLHTEPPVDTITEHPFSIVGGRSKPGDLNGDGKVDVADLLILLSQWGPCADCTPGNCPADLTGDCAVGVGDLLILLANWG